MSVTSKDITKNGGLTVGAEETNTAISEVVALEPSAWRDGFRVSVKVGAATEAAGIDFRVQHTPDLDATSPTWTDVDGTNAKLDPDGTDNKWYSIPISPWNPELDEEWPLHRHIRVVCTTGAGDSIVITSVRLTHAI